MAPAPSIPPLKKQGAGPAINVIFQDLLGVLSETLFQTKQTKQTATTISSLWLSSKEKNEPWASGTG